MLTFHVADVETRLLSVDNSADNGGTVIGEAINPHMIRTKGNTTTLQTKRGLYRMKCDTCRGEAGEGEKDLDTKKNEDVGGEQEQAGKQRERIGNTEE